MIRRHEHWSEEVVQGIIQLAFQGLSTYDIAKIVDMCPEEVRKGMHYNNIPFYRRYKDSRELHWVLRKLTISLKEACEHLDCNYASLIDWKNRLGVIPLNRDKLWFYKKIGQGCSLEQIAERVGYSPNSLNHLLQFYKMRISVPRTPYTYLTDEWVTRRIKKVSRAAIARFYGFDYKSFMRWMAFRGHYIKRGISTKKEWREKFKHFEKYDTANMVAGRWYRFDYNGGLGGLFFPGVYVLILDGVIVYIGSSCDVQHRLTEHFTNGGGHTPVYPMMQTAKTIQIAVQREKRFCERYMIEARLLQRLRPKLNTRYLPTGF